MIQAIGKSWTPTYGHCYRWMRSNWT